jgi:hypothetical protein
MSEHSYRQKIPVKGIKMTIPNTIWRKTLNLGTFPSFDMAWQGPLLAAWGSFLFCRMCIPPGVASDAITPCVRGGSGAGDALLPPFCSKLKWIPDPPHGFCRDALFGFTSMFLTLCFHPCVLITHGLTWIWIPVHTKDRDCVIPGRCLGIIVPKAFFHQPWQWAHTRVFLGKSWVFRKRPVFHGANLV